MKIQSNSSKERYLGANMDNIKSIISKFRKGQDEFFLFNHVIPIFCPKTDLSDNYNSKVKEAFISAFKEGGATNEEALIRWDGISKIIIEGVKSKHNLQSIESKLLEFYKQFLKPTQTEINQNARAARCFNTVKNYLVGESIVDYGCGKGLLGAKIKSELNASVTLVDNIDFNKSNLLLILSDKNGKTTITDLSIDTSIAYLVLHHLDNPFSGLQELARITKKRLILMEGYIEEDQQRYINQTIDWFFNRILLGVDMNVPFNFLTLMDWQQLLIEVGFSIVKTEYVGADEKLAPEHHVLIIADRA